MEITNNILSKIRLAAFDENTLLRRIAGNVRERRLERNLTQAEFARRLGIAMPTYRRFEVTGEISLRRLARIADFFGDAAALAELFTRRHYETLDDVLATTRTPRKRARGHD